MVFRIGPVLALALGVACGPAAAPTDLDLVPHKRQAPGELSGALGCEQLIADGSRQHDAGNYASAIEIFRRGLAACEAHGIHSELADSLVAIGDFDAAANAYLVELRSTRPAPEAVFASLGVILGKLTLERRVEIAGLAWALEAPLRVPSLAFESSWVATFGCPDGPGTPINRLVVDGPNGKVDRLNYTCPSGVEHDAFFVFAAGAPGQ